MRKNPSSYEYIGDLTWSNQWTFHIYVSLDQTRFTWSARTSSRLGRVLPKLGEPLGDRSYVLETAIGPADKCSLDVTPSFWKLVIPFLEAHQDPSVSPNARSA